MIDKIHSMIDDNFDNEIADMQKLLKVETVYNSNAISEEYPLGKNLADCLSLFLDTATDNGFEIKNIDNMIGYAEIGSGSQLVGVLGHLDIVPEGSLDKWISPPYEANIVDGKLYARGVLDNKGPMVACMYALKAMTDVGVQFNKRFRLIVGLDEETQFRCVKRYLETEEVPYFSFSPDASFPVVHAEKGILQFAIKRNFKPLGLEPVKILGMTAGDKVNVVPELAKVYFAGEVSKIAVPVEDLAMKGVTIDYVDDYLKVSADGVSVHAMQPEVGDNAILKLMKLLDKLEFAPVEMKYWIEDFHRLFKDEAFGESLGIACQDEISGKLTIAPTVLWFKGEELIMKFDMRYPVTMTEEEGNAIAESVARKLGAMYQVIKHKAPLNMPKDSVEIGMMLEAYEKFTGEKGEAFAIGGGTYCRAFPNAVSFGPQFPDEVATIHQVNEYATIDNIRKFTHIYAEYLYRMNEQV